MKKKFLILMFVVSLFMLIGSVSAADKNVNPEAINNIQNIIDKANKGDSRLFKEGKYKGINFTVNKSLNIKGNGRVNFICTEDNYQLVIYFTT
ncbi:hypothetical protein ALNOE001_19770 [Candidatus Methanobinarius endosymbioticus]|uniref:Uncharacterized protein n=1 Tax=Candidatus Methanobinarius endosymbioticus TaxID=2006182 RepID=A0A366M8V4_9EURY|nr:hypothetical protein ALNOE001_19770 [Candidatus Methanobinarius endosymbioticus]